MALRLQTSIILLLLSLVFIQQNSSGQSYYSLDFVQNKGQWSGDFKYRADVGNGVLFIDKAGYTILQHHPEDYRKLSERFHSHGHEEEAVNPKNPDLKPPSGGGVPTGLIVRSHALRVAFVGGNNNAAVVEESPRDGYDNYFIGNDSTRWRSNVQTFSVLRFRDVYPGIDVKYYTDGGKLKYDFVVSPGADPAKVRIRYNGSEKISVARNGDLLIKTSVGEVKELVPYAYQIVNGIKKEVNCRYTVSDSQVSFSLKNYDNRYPLVIDPTLIFSTYTGSRSGNWGFTATPGADGSFFAGGVVFNGGGYPTTPGAFQTSYQGGGRDLGVDIGITRFNPNGTARIYSTYLGGSADEFPHSLFADPQGNLVVLGRTSSPNYPTRVPAFGTPGGFDIIVTKLNAAGTGLIGSIRIGGSNDDGANIEAGGQPGCSSLLYNYGDNARSEVVLDGANNVYVAASTKSDNFPTLNAFQNTLGGKQDAVLIKLNPNLSSVIFSTYFGGSEDDAGFVLALNPVTGNIYMAGATASSNLRVATNTYNGAIDGYVAVVPNNGGNLLQSRYFGTASLDIIYGIQFDISGFPYIMGISLGSWPVQNAPYSNPGSKQFISKLQPDLSAFVYSTVYGSPNAVPNISPVAFLVDRCENVYISGWGGRLNPCTSGSCFDSKTSGTAGMPVTSDAIKGNTDGRDFYFFVMERDATRQLYGSFFGQTGGEGDHVDGGTARFDTRGAIYQAICANCLGNNACASSPITQPIPTTPGVVAPQNGALGSGSGGDCNLAAIKILFDYQGVIASVRSEIGGVINDSTGCAPLTVNFSDTIANGTRYEWDFGDGTPGVVTTEPDVTHTFTNVGTYRVRLIAVDSSKCIPRDTAYKFVVASADRANIDFSNVKLPPCEALNYRFDNLSVAPPGKPFGATSFIWDFGDNSPRITTGNGSVNHTFAAPGTYNVRLVMVDTNYCNFPDSVTRTLRVAPNVEARFNTPASGCAPYTANFTNTSLAGETFIWDFGDGTSFTGATPPPKLYNTPGTYNVTLIAIDPNTCNLRDTTAARITVSAGPVANFRFAPDPPQENTPTQFTNLSVGAVRYRWSFGDGDTSVQVNPVHQYNRTGTFEACLIAINQFNCADTVCQNVQSVIVSVLDVPNAFSPNGDGVNDMVYVRGFGIDKMVWRIYNRQGLLVFQSASQLIGWDGRYKGVLQPMDAYGYSLEVQFSDGTRATRTGNITLLR